MLIILMRPSLFAPLLLACLISACAATKDKPAQSINPIQQSGTLKVHPGLLGQTVPAELQAPASPTAPPTDTMGR